MVSTFNELKLVSGEKEVGSKEASINGSKCGTVALGIFFFSGFSPYLVVNKFPLTVIPAQSVDAKGRHGGQNCFERR